MSLVVSEVLCYLQNNFGKFPRGLLVTTVSGFYEEKEVSEAKSLLYSTVKKMDITSDDVPRYKKRQGEQKNRGDVEDIIGLFEYFDTKQLSLPVDFVAKNLQRLPALSLSDVDVYKLAESVKELGNQMRGLQEAVGSVVQAQVDGSAVRTTSTDSGLADKVVPETSMSTSCVNFAQLMKDQEVAEQWFKAKASTEAESKKRLIRKITGGKQNTTVKAVDSEWHLFVGRLTPDTTEDDVRGLLTAQNIKVVNCKLLPKKEEWQKNYSAFRVVIYSADKDNVFEADIWPFGADVRDWYFKSK